MATLVLAAVEMVYSAPSPGAGTPASSSSAVPSTVERACPLSASPEACDTCMLASCLPSCRACAENPSCLRLFACLMDCTDPECEQRCAERDPDGKRDLSAFLGEGGCLARRCSAVCP